MTRVNSNLVVAEATVATETGILARPQVACSLCGEPGNILYSGLIDRQSPSQGVWSIRRCVDPQCGLMWLDPAPLETELHKAYESYYTHAGRKSNEGVIARVMSAMKRGYVANCFGYREGVSRTNETA